MPIFSAIVLAAGQSKRMGRDKALLEVQGQPLWQRQRDVLLHAGAGEILLSARPEQTWTRGIRGFSSVVHDSMPDCGPMVGVTAGLERASYPWLAVLAIDLPQMSPRWFRQLLGRISLGKGVVGRRDGYFEPLAAIYPRELRWLAWESLARADYSLQKLITRAVDEDILQVSEITPADAPEFANWNEPELAR